MMMNVSDSALHIEFAIDTEGEDAIAAYDEPALGHATSLTVDHADMTISAAVPGPDGALRLECGTVSMRTARRLAHFDRILWARVEGMQTIAVAEIAVAHINRRSTGMIKTDHTHPRKLDEGRIPSSSGMLRTG
jgi:hypothetical protein